MRSAVPCCPGAAERLKRLQQAMMYANVHTNTARRCIPENFCFESRLLHLLHTTSGAFTRLARLFPFAFAFNMNSAICGTARVEALPPGGKTC